MPDLYESWQNMICTPPQNSNHILPLQKLPLTLFRPFMFHFECGLSMLHNATLTTLFWDSNDRPLIICWRTFWTDAKLVEGKGFATVHNLTVLSTVRALFTDTLWRREQYRQSIVRKTELQTFLPLCSIPQQDSGNLFHNLFLSWLFWYLYTLVQLKPLKSVKTSPFCENASCSQTPYRLQRL